MPNNRGFCLSRTFTGLGSIYKEGENVWIGWPGVSVTSKNESEVRRELRKESMAPVFLTEQEIHDYYEGFSNGTLWPLFHYFNQYVIFDEHLWQVYKKVNRKFAKEVLAHAQPGDTIWIQDYQLLLLPQMIREEVPDSNIGFFNHIPFPSYEAFRMLPWRKEILEGMLGSDLIGFHTYDDMRHFLSCVNRLAGISNSHGEVIVGSRKVIVDSFPMGIDYERYAASAASPETLEKEVKYRTSLNYENLMLSIDRLDYSKGIPQRLLAFERFLTENPEFKERVSILMVVVPSRDQVEMYRQLKEEIDLLVGRINGKFGTLGWTPVHYFYRGFSLPSLSAFYRMANVALVTPLRDGMNLVCKEFIASKLDQKGVLILSEMAGASKELSDAILINPNDINAHANAMKEALIMPLAEQKERIQIMQASLQKYNIHHWVRVFMERLAFVKQTQQSLLTKALNVSSKKLIKGAYKEANKRTLFLDYDGTLRSFVANPTDAKPDEELLDTLSKLAKDPANRVVVISGRDRHTLGEWLGHLPIDLIAEHGTAHRKIGGDWKEFSGLTDSWKKEIHDLLELYVDRTPGSLIEEKKYSLAWHYRKVETGLGAQRTRELSSHLKYLTADDRLQVLEGDKVVEIKNQDVNKGVAAGKWMKLYPADFVIAIGDDKTDEDTFKSVGDKGYTVKVGAAASQALYNVPDVAGVREFLNYLMNKSVNPKPAAKTTGKKKAAKKAAKS
jgi:trehalose 6-phosphate synthase/phosphatase